MSIEEVAGVLVALVIVGASVAFGLRVSAASMNALRERVATTNATLRSLATRFGLALSEPAPHHLPTAGDAPAYATATGSYRGRVVRINVESDEDTRQFVVNVSADPARPWPDLGRLKPGDHPRLAPALAVLQPRASEIRVTPTALRVVPVEPKDPSSEEGELAAVVDAAVALAKALDESNVA